MYVNLLVGLFFLVVVVMLMRRLGVGRLRPAKVMREEMERRRIEAEHDLARNSLAQAASEALQPVAAALREMLDELPEGDRPGMEVTPDAIIVHLTEGPLVVSYRFRRVTLDASRRPDTGQHGEWVLRDATGEVADPELDVAVRLLARRIADSVH